jgi:hypothetical protein
MIKEKKKQIVTAEKTALQNEMKQAYPGKASGPAKTAPVAMDQKKKIADAVKAVIKSTQEEQGKLEELRKAGKKA